MGVSRLKTERAEICCNVLFYHSPGQWILRQDTTFVPTSVTANGYQNTVKKRNNINCTLVQTMRLCTGRMAHRGSRSIILPFLDHGTRRGWGVSVTPRPLFTPRKDPVPIVQEAGWGPRPVWTGVENLAHTGIQSPDRPARSQSLYRLSYRAHLHIVWAKQSCI